MHGGRTASVAGNQSRSLDNEELAARLPVVGTGFRVEEDHRALEGRIDDLDLALSHGT